MEERIPLPKSFNYLFLYCFKVREKSNSHFKFAKIQAQVGSGSELAKYWIRIFNSDIATLQLVLSSFFSFFAYYGDERARAETAEETDVRFRGAERRTQQAYRQHQVRHRNRTLTPSLIRQLSHVEGTVLSPLAFCYLISTL